MGYGKEDELSSVVSHAAALANARLLELLSDKFELRAHIANLQQYLLVGKGDFAQALMEHIAPQLGKPADKLHRHHLLSLVEGAVRTSASGANEGEYAPPLAPRPPRGLVHVHGAWCMCMCAPRAPRGLVRGLALVCAGSRARARMPRVRAQVRAAPQAPRRLSQPTAGRHGMGRLLARLPGGIAVRYRLLSKGVNRPCGPTLCTDPHTHTRRSPRHPLAAPLAPDTLAPSYLPTT